MPSIVRESELPWYQGSSQIRDGVKRSTRFKPLSTLEPGPQMLLVELDPHLRIERHSHSANHQIYVLEGQLRAGGEWVGAGGCISLEAGYVYGPEMAGPEGCRCLLVFSEPATTHYEDPDSDNTPDSLQEIG